MQHLEEQEQRLEQEARAAGASAVHLAALKHSVEALGQELQGALPAEGAGRGGGVGRRARELQQALLAEVRGGGGGCCRLQACGCGACRSRRRLRAAALAWRLAQAQDAASQAPQVLTRAIQAAPSTGLDGFPSPQPPLHRLTASPATPPAPVPFCCS
jgi:hypothetical protein